MKTSIIVIVAAVLAVGAAVFGCSRMAKNDSPSGASDSSGIKGTASAVSEASGEEIKELLSACKPLSEETEWGLMFLHSENPAAYERALRCVPNPIPGAVLSKSSARFADWFLLDLYVRPGEDEEVLDEEPPRASYLVNLSAEKFVAANDFEAARPLFERHVALIRACEDDGERGMLIDRLAEIATVIAFNHGDIVRSDTPANKDLAAQFESDGRASKAVFHISRHASYVSYEVATLTITPEKIALEVADFDGE